MNASGDEPTTLRAELDRRREAGERFRLKEIVAVMVPLLTDLAERHEGGARLFVYPDAILFDPSGGMLDAGSAALEPTDPRDRACIAPEERHGAPGDARATVFSVGAILYELVTGESVGPGMRRPSEVVSYLPKSFEQLVGKALVANPASRPHDLAALAQALHHCAPTGSIPPPPADESHLDHDIGFDVDVSMSMLPPPPAIGGVAPKPLPPPDRPSAPTGGSSTAVLAELKSRLEADPRPRYIVIKDGMDHGPFNAVELLQQIATGNFSGDNVLRDNLSKDEQPIADWHEFAPFADQARLSKEAESERAALEQGVQAETERARWKVFAGGAIIALSAAAFLGWYFQARRSADDGTAVKGQEGQSVDFEGGLKGGAKGGAGRPGGGRWVGGRKVGGDGEGPSVPAGNYPAVSGGGSCESARASYVEQYNMANGQGAPPDLSAGQFGGVLNRGGYLNSCGVPPNMGVSICAAIQNGRAVGVTVRTTPANGGIAACVRGAVFGMSFPAHPRMDITTTVFKAEQ